MATSIRFELMLRDSKSRVLTTTLTGNNSVNNSSVRACLSVSGVVHKVIIT